MGLQAAPAYIAATGFQHPATLDRNLLEGLFGGRAGGLRAGDFLVTPGVGTRAIFVSAGRYTLLGTENAQQGSYFAWNDTGDTFLLGAGVGNPRIDSLILRIHDDQYGSIPGSPGAYWEVVQGVASGSPSARADSDFNVGGSFYVPGAWARIADVRVNVGDTSIPGGQITGTQRYARFTGHTICSSSTRPSDPVINDRIYEYDTDFTRRWNGSAWVQDAPYVRNVTLGSPAADIQFTSIPSSLRTLRITYGARCVGAVVIDNILCRINGVTSGHVYNRRSLQNTTQNNLANDQGAGSFPIGLVPGASGGSAQDYGDGEIILNNWNHGNSARLKSLWQSGVYTSTSIIREDGQGMVTNNGPYTSVRLFVGSNMGTGSWARLEGWE